MLSCRTWGNIGSDQWGCGHGQCTLIYFDAHTGVHTLVWTNHDSNIANVGWTLFSGVRSQTWGSFAVTVELDHGQCTVINFDAHTGAHTLIWTNHDNIANAGWTLFRVQHLCNYESSALASTCYCLQSPVFMQL